MHVTTQDSRPWGHPSPDPGIVALRRLLDAAPPQRAAGTPRLPVGSLAAPSPARPVLLLAAEQNVWAIPRPRLPALARAQWRGLVTFALALGCLWYLDMLTTAWALQHGGVEGGPLAKFLVSHNMIPLLVAKVTGLAAIVLLGALQIARKREGLARWSLGMVGAISLGVVEWNLLGILAIVGVLG